MGIPTTYTPEIAKEICDKVASCSTGIKKLCKQHDHWPSYQTIYQWLRIHKYFRDLYTLAKRDQIQALVDEILEISDDSTHDDKEIESGAVVCNAEWIARSRLKVDTRKWLAAKLVPRLYGDNMLARELADEMEELRETLKKGLSNGKANDRKAKKNTKK